MWKRCMKRAKENWIGEQCSEIEENLRKNNSKRAYQQVKGLTTVKQGKATTVQDRSGKCLTEEQQILNRSTKYCSELYSYKANGDPSVLNCPQTVAEDDHPILRREVEAAVQSLKKRKSAGVDNIPAETGLDWQEYFSQLQDMTDVLPCHIHLPVCLWIKDPNSRAPKRNTSHGNEVLPQDTAHLIQRPCYQRGIPPSRQSDHTKTWPL